MSYLQKDFLLSNETAKKLYFDAAKDMPIFDYHCHLPEKDILADKPFGSITEMWLGGKGYGDHYKWRLMRAYGVPESLVTGPADPKERFFAYCEALEGAYGNPLQAWSQAELETYFHCSLTLNKKNAPAIWEACEEYRKSHPMHPSSVIEESHVKHLFTTNEIFDDLSTFEKIQEKGYGFTVNPAYRADKIMNIEASSYLEFLGKLEACSHPIHSLANLEDALEERLNAFQKVGYKAADISLTKIEKIPEEGEAAKVFEKRLSGSALTEEEVAIFKGYFTYFLMKMHARHGIAVELHIAPMRNNNSAMFEELGLDSGYDAIAEEDSTRNLSRLLDRLNSEHALPKVILFPLNPKMYQESMALLGCFQGESKGKMQLGAAWWFNDNEPGIRKQLATFAENGHLGTFLGMLTDSRSFISYPRHQYFRRILCDYLGTMMEEGKMSNDLEEVETVVRDICYNNALAYFGLED